MQALSLDVTLSDCDNTSCGYKTCKNGGSCSVTSENDFTCTCSSSYVSKTCEIHVQCETAAVCMATANPMFYVRVTFAVAATAGKESCVTKVWGIILGWRQDLSDGSKRGVRGYGQAKHVPRILLPVHAATGRYCADRAGGYTELNCCQYKAM